MVSGNTGLKRQKYFTSHPSKYPQGHFKPKDCRWCGTTFEPTGPSHHYCSDTCRRKVASDKFYKRSYGTDLKTVMQMLDDQGWKCAICKKFGFKMREDHVSGLNLDHCHTTGEVRGLLCHNCNRGLGLFNDNLGYLESAMRYLRDHDTRRNEGITRGRTEKNHKTYSGRS